METAGYQDSAFDRGERRPLDVYLPDQANLIGVQYWPERIEPKAIRQDGLQPDVIRPDAAIYVTLYWQATQPISRAFQTVVQLAAPDTGQVWEQGKALTPQSVSIDDWQPGQVIAERFVVPVPDDLPAGAHQLAMHLTTFQSRALPLYREDASPVDRVSLGYVVVPLPEDVRAPLSEAQAVNATVGRGIRLLGFQSSDVLSPGEGLEVKLFWGAEQQPEEDYVQLVASHDGTPMSRRYPTGAWRPGDVVPDVHPIPLGADLPAGTYRLLVGMYRWPSLERLPIWDEQDIEKPDRSLSLGTVQVR